MPTSTPSISITHAKRLRQDMTDAERYLWYALRRRSLNGWRFRRQAPIGRYIVDFTCFGAKLVVELDGGQHAEDRRDYDERRTEWLVAQGFTVLRFWNADVFQNTEFVLDEFVKALPGDAPPQPSPTRGEGV
ncbi:MAG TPA: endonuclease domain-containing protein [Vineibacter sp.]|nr:endonuclease domain-containing protein [Vineibacter sp.]